MYLYYTGEHFVTHKCRFVWSGTLTRTGWCWEQAWIEQVIRRPLQISLINNLDISFRVLVTYELNHAHFVQDIFEAITIYLKIQLQIAISDTSNFL